MNNVIFLLFNVPPIILIAGIIILFMKEKCSRGVRNSMSLLLLTLAITMGLYAEYFNPLIVDNHFWIFDFFFCLTVPFCPPAYFLFLNRLTDRRKTPTLNIMIFLPAIIFGAMLLTAKILMSDTERYAFVANEILGQSIQIESSMAYDWMVFLLKHVFGIFIAIEGIIVMIYGEFRLTTYLSLQDKYRVKMNYPKNGKPYRVHIFTLIVTSLFLFMSVIPLSEVTKHLWFLLLILVIEMSMVLLIFSFARRVEYSAGDLYAMLGEEKDNSVRKHSIIPETVRINPVVKPTVVAHEEMPTPTVNVVEPGAPLIERIDAMMENEKLYLHPELSIVMLSEKMGTNRTYVSKAIKDAKGCNFPDYVNRFRLDYALSLMEGLSKDEIVIQNIAVQCGCGSIQTFYRYFKMFYNETPSQWIERNK